MWEGEVCEGVTGLVWHLSAFVCSLEVGMHCHVLSGTAIALVANASHLHMYIHMYWHIPPPFASRMWRR